MSFLVSNATAEHPTPIQEFDEPVLHHGPAGWEPVDVDAYELVQEARGLGATQAGTAVCPPCSYHDGARCVWCPPDAEAAAEIPECDKCDGRTPPVSPWYTKSEIVVPVVTAVVVTVLGTVVSAIVLKRLGQKAA